MKAKKNYTEQDIGCYFHLLREEKVNWNPRAKMVLPKGTSLFCVAVSKGRARFRIATKEYIEGRYEFPRKNVERGSYVCECCHRELEPQELYMIHSKI
jgi:hypothetical protein